MSQTREIRIYKHYQSLKHVGKNGNRCFQHDDSDLILKLAEHWKMSCKEIKNIVRAAQSLNQEKDDGFDNQMKQPFGCGCNRLDKNTF